MGDDCSGTSGRHPHEVPGEELAELVTTAIKSTMRVIIGDLRDVFEVETLKLEARLRSGSLALATSVRHRSPPFDVASPLSDGSLPYVSDASADGVEASQVRTRHNRQRKARHENSALEREMMDAAFDAKFGQGRGGGRASDSDSLSSPSLSLVPMESFVSPVPRVGQGELRMTTIFSSMSSVPLLKSCLFRALPFVTARLCGVVPWHGKIKYLSAAYQWVIILSLCCCLCVQCFTFDPAQHTSGIIDMCLTIGALLTLLACGALWQSHGLALCAGRLDAYVQEYCCQYLLDKRSFTDTLASFFLVAFLVVLRTVPKGKVDISDSIFAIVCCVISGIVCYLVHMCTVVGWLVDSYCAQMVSKDAYVDAAKEWYLLDSLCRLLCSTIQYGFFSLQVTCMATLIFLFSLCIQSEGSLEGILTTVLCVVVMMRPWFYAAMLSEKCKRVPRLFNNAGNGQLDTGRTQVVQYIQHCSSGFDLFGMRINFELTLKIAYGMCAASFTLLSRASIQQWNE